MKNALMRFWNRLPPVAKISMGILIVMAIISIFGPWLLPKSYALPSSLRYAPPSLVHPFGTDLNGRDMLYRVLEGGQISLLVGLAGALISMTIGVTYGMVAGYVGGRTDAIMMRGVDILYSVPRLIFILIFINAFNQKFQEFVVSQGWTFLVGSSRIFILIASLGFIEWLTMARIVRGQTLSLKSLPFVAAAKALGQSHVKIILYHILPNLIGIAVIYLTLTIPAVIIDESFLSFLGLGVQAPQSSWGLLLADGASAINPLKSYWWLLVFPAIAMSVTLLALNFVGDALRDYFDPKNH